MKSSTLEREKIVFLFKSAPSASRFFFILFQSPDTTSNGDTITHQSLSLSNYKSVAIPLIAVNLFHKMGNDKHRLLQGLYNIK